MPSTCAFLRLCILLTLTTFTFAQQSLIFDPTKSTKLRFTSDFRNANTRVAVVLTTAQDRVNGAFLFDPSSTVRDPRILSAVQVVPYNKTYGVATIPPLSLAESYSNLTVHYFLMQDAMQSDTGYTYTVAGSLDIKTNDFLPVGDTPDGLLYDLSELPDRTEYLTLVYNSMISHNSTVSASCSYTVQYTGIIRSIFFNDDRQGQWGLAEDDIYSVQTFTSGTVKLGPSELVMLTIVGYRLNVMSFNVHDCYSTDVSPSQALSVNFTYYALGSSISAPQGISFNNQTSTCETEAERCIDITETLKCQPGYYRANSQCYAMCPADQLTVTILNDCSTFSYEDVRLGYKASDQSLDTENNTIFSYYLDLAASTTVLTIFWPSDTQVITPIPMWFSTGNYLLATAVFSLDTLPDDGMIEYAVGLNLLPTGQDDTEPQKQIQYTHHEIITDSQQTLMVAVYDSEPTTEEEMQNPTSFTYASHDQLISIDPMSVTYITTFLNCRQACTVSVSANGYVEATRDYRTFLFGVTFGSTAWAYTLSDNFLGVTALTFKTKGTSSFQFQVSGTSYTVFSHGFPVTKQNISFATNNQKDTLSTGCLNGENGICYSCQEGYLLNEVTNQCVTSCPNGFLTYTFERKCFAIQCSNNTVQTGNGLCLPKCDNVDQIYVEGQGCGGKCLKGCNLCSNSTGVCLDCVYADINSVSECSHCPPGSTFDSSTSACTSTSTISIMGPSQTSACSDLLLTVSIDPVEELFLCPIDYTWTVSSTQSNANSRALQALLKTQTLKELVVPAKYLTLNNNYTFTVQYLNALSQVVSTSFTAYVVSNPYPPITIDGGGNKVLYYYDVNTLKARVVYSETCFPITEAVQAQWKQISGPTIDMTSGSSAITSPFWAAIPSCSLQPGSTYEFEVDVWKVGTPNNKASLTTQFRVPPINFTVEIMNGNRLVPASADINVQTKLNYRTGDCPVIDDGVQVTYQWTCQIKKTGAADSTYRACINTNQTFNTEITNSTIKIPASNFREGDSMQIGVTAFKGNDSTFTSVVLSVGSTDTLSVTLECINCQAGASNYDGLLFQGAITDSYVQGQKIDYKWAVTPTLTNTAYKNQLKVYTDPQATANSSIMVNFQAQVGSQSSTERFLQNSADSADETTVQTSITVALNAPPQGGNLTISPTSGTSLSTYFHIVASNWQDDNGPLAYDFFYYYEGGPEIRLTDQQRYPYILTMLPGNASTTTLYIKVVVTDSLGASANTTMTVEVFPRGTNIADTLNIIKTDFGGITTSGDPSITQAEPFEMLKTLAFMGREVNSYENANVTSTEYTEKLRNSVINFKMGLMNNLQSVHDTISNQDTDEVLIQAVDTLIYNTLFNIPASLMLTVAGMGTSLSNTNVLSSRDIFGMAQIIANILANFGVTAFSYSTNQAQQLRDFTDVWLNKLRDNILDDKMPGDAPTILQTVNFDAYVTQTTGCQMINTTIKTSDNSPSFVVGVLAGSENDAAFSCDTVYNLIYYAFDPNLPSIQNPDSLVNSQKSLIAFTIADQNFQTLNLPVAFLVSGVDTCPDGCSVMPEGGCQCLALTTFNQEYVLDVLFGLLPTSFNIWIIVPFEVVLASVIWLLLSLLLVRYIMPRYCKIAQFQALENKTRLKALITAIWVCPKLLSLYTYVDKDLPKVRRVFLYFLRIQLFAVLGGLLAKASTHTTVTGILNQDIGTSLPSFLAVLVIPFGTIYPIYALLEILLRNYKSNRVDTIRRLRTQRSQDFARAKYQQGSGEPPSNTKCYYMMGVLLALGLLIASQAYIWIAGWNDHKIEHRYAWLTYLIFALIVDLTAAPLVVYTINYIGALIWATKSVQSGKFLKGVLESLIDKKIMIIKKGLMANTNPGNRVTDMKTEPKDINIPVTEGQPQEPEVIHGDAIPLDNDRQLQPDVVHANTDALDYRNVNRIFIKPREESEPEPDEVESGQEYSR